ncbi:SUCLG2 [Cordylochernes scorpioides]|uniref:Succinate--CoA ligase [ADP-forming] subunit beta, mitochondrial n=1 Tax=Cordylochernes scorpioides TaxID=51811 RepID=A0ABY6KXM0_9ARAC|nr:SUCLG2 [Cordylochernes scorpioides]
MEYKRCSSCIPGSGALTEYYQPGQLSPASVRWLNLQEYQSKQLMADNGIKVQRFQVAQSLDQAKSIASTLSHDNHDVDEFVIKAQILAGGRGKGTFSSGLKGGVQLTKNPQAVPAIVEQMLGYKLVTKQTPKEGVAVNKVMIAEALDIARETYLAILMDRSHNGPVVVASPAGGVDIEEVAEKTPELIYKVTTTLSTIPDNLDIKEGLSKDKAMQIAKDLRFPPNLQEEAAAQIARLYQLFLKVDATQIEINPFGETPQGRVTFVERTSQDPIISLQLQNRSILSIFCHYCHLRFKLMLPLFLVLFSNHTMSVPVVCFDAKVNFDDNAQFRQKDIFGMEDHAESDPREVEASRHHLNYIGMDGNIGCLGHDNHVNGAGLAMATMDIIQLYGGSPANFLDVGGSVREEQVKLAFELITSDPKVKAVLVNIFGGIVNCATIANGITNACKSMNLSIPLVVRLEGTNVEEAKKILRESKLPIITADNLGDAAKKAVESLNQ